MRYLTALALLFACTATASANTFKLECLDAYDGKTRLALIEINTDSAIVRVYSEEEHDWKNAIDVSIADSTISFVEAVFNDASAPHTSVSINRETGKYFAYTTHAARKDGLCRKIA